MRSAWSGRRRARAPDTTAPASYSGGGDKALGERRVLEHDGGAAPEPELGAGRYVVVDEKPAAAALGALVDAALVLDREPVAVVEAHLTDLTGSSHEPMMHGGCVRE